MGGKIKYIFESTKPHGRFSRWKTTDGTVNAYINHGRWVADCPDCSGAELVNKTERKFWCESCHNTFNNGKCRRVIFPRNWNAIEKVILARPNLKNRNWKLSETIKDLKRQNKENGDPLEVTYDI